MDDDKLIFDRNKPFFPQAADHAVDMRPAEAQHVGHQLLRQRQHVRQFVGETGGAQPDKQLQDQVREAFIGRPAPEIDHMLAIHRHLAPRGPEQCGGEAGEMREHAEQCRERQRRDHDISQRGDRVDRDLKEAGREPYQVPRQSQVQDLPLAVGQYFIAGNKALTEDEQCVVTLAGDNNLPMSRQFSPRFVQGAQELGLGVGHGQVGLQSLQQREGVDGRQLLSILDEKKLRRVLSKMLDENEFFGPYGIRSLSRFHEKHPFEIDVHGEAYKVQYLPAESNNGMFGGNSNWRGPVWMPVNMLIVRALLQYYLYYGDSLQVECPTGSGHMMNLFEVTQELSKRLAGIFLRGEDGRRPVYGGSKLFQDDPHWRDLILFYEYFHGDNGAGLGASHQTGWTGTVARLIQLFGHLRAKDLLEGENVRPVTADYEDPR